MDTNYIIILTACINTAIVLSVIIAIQRAQNRQIRCIIRKIDAIGQFIVKQKIYNKISNPKKYNQVFSDTDNELSEFTNGDPVDSVLSSLDKLNKV